MEPLLVDLSSQHQMVAATSLPGHGLIKLATGSRSCVNFSFPAVSRMIDQ
jgi:hypothetical protein